MLHISCHHTRRSIRITIFCLQRDRKQDEEKKKLEEAEAAAQEKAESKDKSGRFDDDHEEDYWVDFEEEENKYLDMLKRKKLSKELPVRVGHRIRLDKASIPQGNMACCFVHSTAQFCSWVIRPALHHSPQGCSCCLR